MYVGSVGVMLNELNYDSIYYNIATTNLKVLKLQTSFWSRDEPPRVPVPSKRQCLLNIMSDIMRKVSKKTDSLQRADTEGADSTATHI